MLTPMNESPNEKSLEAAISKKCGDIVSLKMVWNRAVRKALDQNVSEATTISLLQSLRSPRTLEILVDAKGTELDGFLENLKRLADSSPYALADWFDAYEHLQARLVRDGRMAAPDSIIGYIHCSADFASGGGPQAPLTSLVLEMLERYGFEGQDGCSTG